MHVRCTWHIQPTQAPTPTQLGNGVEWMRAIGLCIGTVLASLHAVAAAHGQNSVDRRFTLQHIRQRWLLWVGVRVCGTDVVRIKLHMELHAVCMCMELHAVCIGFYSWYCVGTYIQCMRVCTPTPPPHPPTCVHCATRVVFLHKALYRRHPPMRGMSTQMLPSKLSALQYPDVLLRAWCGGCNTFVQDSGGCTMHIAVQSPKNTIITPPCSCLRVCIQSCQALLCTGC